MSGQEEVDFRVALVPELGKRDLRVMAAINDAVIRSIRPVLVLEFPTDYGWHKSYLAEKRLLLEEAVEVVLGERVPVRIVDN